VEKGAEASMKRAELLTFMRGERYAVQASMGAAGPQAAVVGIAVGDDFELAFDTIETTRKGQNLRRDSRIAFVIGGREGDERTVQYQGIADEPTGEELALLKRLYFGRFPDGPTRESWEGITYFRVRPTWLRYSDFNQNPALIVELTAEQLAALT
jgi:hypothetical protein